MEKEREPVEGSGSALEHLQRWLAERSVSAEQAFLAAERVKDFCAEASVIVGFPIAVGITQTKEARTLCLHLIWPSAIPPIERVSYESPLREAFQRDLAAPMPSELSCQLVFTAGPPREEDYACYLGPSPDGYEPFVESFRAAARAAAKAPDLVQQLEGLIERLPGKSEAERRAVVEQLRELAARLHAA